MDLLPKLARVADAWVDAHRRSDPNVSLKTLGSRASGNSKLFERKSMNVETFERLVLWLGEPANWPAALVPAEAAHALGDLGVAVPGESWLPLPVAA